MAEILRKYLVLPLLALFFGSGCVAGQSKESPADAVVIDVRTISEFNGAHITGAKNIPYDEISRVIGNTVKNKKSPIAVYCRSGRRSAMAKESLVKLGYRSVFDLGTMESASTILKREIEMP